MENLRTYFLSLQKKITKAMGELDGKSFIEDAWTKAKGSELQGDGCSCLLERGNLFERAGVAFSHVRGEKLPRSATAHRRCLAA